MKKEYSLQELANILGCSRTAITKKIKSAGDNTNIKRYKDRYDIVMIEGKMHVVLDEAELEQEKKLSKGFNNVSDEGYNTVESDSIIDVEPVKEEKTKTDIIEFTECYIERFTTLQETMYNELSKRDKQVLLLEKSENTTKYELFKVQSENKTLKEKSNVLLTVALIFITLFITVSIGFITFALSVNNVSQPVNNVSETVTNVQEQAATPQVLQPVNNVSNQRKR